MPDNSFRIGASANIGTGRRHQEDMVQIFEPDETKLFVMMADGAGSREGLLPPAGIIWDTVYDYLSSFFGEDASPEVTGTFLEDPGFYMKQALLMANRVVRGFKLGNEELYSGYGASVTLVFFHDGRRGGQEGRFMTIVHSGNTRAYLLRGGSLHMLTKDHTEGEQLLREKKISIDDYYVMPSSLVLTSAIGVMPSPEIQVLKGKMKKNDLIVLTTDGVHYAIRPDAMAQFILEAQECEDAALDLIAAALSTEYPDNAAAAVVRIRGQA